MRGSLFLAAFLSAVMPSLAVAQTYPARPVRLIIAVPPGGAADFTARIVGQKLAEAVSKKYQGQ